MRPIILHTWWLVRSIEVWLRFEKRVFGNHPFIVPNLLANRDFLGYQIKKRANIPNEIATTTHTEPRTSCNSCCLAWPGLVGFVLLPCVGSVLVWFISSLSHSLSASNMLALCVSVVLFCLALFAAKHKCVRAMFVRLAQCCCSLAQLIF